MRIHPTLAEFFFWHTHAPEESFTHTIPGNPCSNPGCDEIFYTRIGARRQPPGNDQ
jgi:hypothetical protein